MNKPIVVVLALFVAANLSASIPEMPELNPWNELALSVPRSNIAAVSANNYAILAGGLYQNGTASDVVDVLDVKTKSISQLTLSAPRYNLLSTATEKYAIFAGGNETLENNETMSNVNVIEVLDVDSMQWKTTQFPDSFYVPEYTVVTATNNLVVFCNGTHAAIFDPAASENAWILSEPLSETTARAKAAATVGSTAFFAIDRPSPLIISIDVATPSEHNLALFPEYRTYVNSALAVGQRIYFAIEDATPGATSSFLIFDSQSSSWELTRFPTPARSFLGAVAIQGDIIVVTESTMDIMIVAEGLWYSISANNGLSAAVTVVNDNYLVIAGGTNGTDVTNALRVFEYDPPAAPATSNTPGSPSATSGTTFCAVSVAGMIASIALVLL